LPAKVQQEVGGTVADLMAKNYSPDWYIVGSSLEAHTRQMEELIQRTKQ
jgi:hypothetical protein